MGVDEGLPVIDLLGTSVPPVAGSFLIGDGYPDDPDDVWKRFVDALRKLLQDGTIREDVKHRGESIVQWIGSLMISLEDPEVATQIGGYMRGMLANPDSAPGIRLILMEMGSFATYVDRLVRVQQEEGGFVLPSPEAARRDGLEGLSIAGTVGESLRDLFDNLPFKLKALIKSISEAVEIVRELV